ncbi:MAG: hypothetical protein ACOYN2_04735 [Patescibacteria group bacterium]
MAISIHAWEKSQAWFGGNIHDTKQNCDPSFNPVGYIQAASERAKLHGITEIPVIAPPAQTKDSEFFERILGFLNIKFRNIQEA